MPLDCTMSARSSPRDSSAGEVEKNSARCPRLASIAYSVAASPYRRSRTNALTKARSQVHLFRPAPVHAAVVEGLTVARKAASGFVTKPVKATRSAICNLSRPTTRRSSPIDFGFLPMNSSTGMPLSTCTFLNAASTVSAQ